MARYRRKISTVFAEKFIGGATNAREVANKLPSGFTATWIQPRALEDGFKLNEYLKVEDRNHEVFVNPGAWIVISGKDVYSLGDGDFQDQFEAI